MSLQSRWRWTTERFQAHLRYCLSIVDADPESARELVGEALLNAPTPCLAVQAWGLWSQIQRALGNLDRAEASLEIALCHAENCPDCHADLHRRKAYVLRDRRDFPGALASADEAIRSYIELGHPGHDLYGNGLASSYGVRATILFEAGDPSESGAESRRALALTDPVASPQLYRLVLTNLANALQATGLYSDLLEADEILRQARRRFKGVRKCSQERAKLTWVTAMVRHQLGREKPYRIHDMLMRVLSDFLELEGFPQECAAVVADVARIAWPHGDCRSRIRSLLQNVGGRLPLAHLAPEIRDALNEVHRANEALGFQAHKSLGTAIEALREACGPKMIPCLITCW